MAQLWTGSHPQAVARKSLCRDFFGILLPQKAGELGVLPLAVTEPTQDFRNYNLAEQKSRCVQFQLAARKKGSNIGCVCFRIARGSRGYERLSDLFAYASWQISIAASPSFAPLILYSATCLPDWETIRELFEAS
jgi:hypothetical protein